MRDVAEAIEAVAARKEFAVKGVWGLLRHERAAQAVVRETTRILDAKEVGDVEMLLSVSNERGWTRQRPPGTLPSMLESAQLCLRSYLESGSGTMGHLNATIKYGKALDGRHQDTRDPDSIAEEFLQRVQGLARLQGDETMDAHLEQARRDVLAGVPRRMLSRVLEHVLDREERAAQGQDVELLRQDREGRRERGWRALTSKVSESDPPKLGR